MRSELAIVLRRWAMGDDDAGDLEAGQADCLKAVAIAMGMRRTLDPAPEILEAGWLLHRHAEELGSIAAGVSFVSCDVRGSSSKPASSSRACA
jgi:hypothetical protein